MLSVTAPRLFQLFRSTHVLQQASSGLNTTAAARFMVTKDVIPKDASHDEFWGISEMAITEWAQKKFNDPAFLASISQHLFVAVSLVSDIGPSKYPISAYSFLKEPILTPDATTGKVANLAFSVLLREMRKEIVKICSSEEEAILPNKIAATIYTAPHTSFTGRIV